MGLRLRVWGSGHWSSCCYGLQHDRPPASHSADAQYWSVQARTLLEQRSVVVKTNKKPFCLHREPTWATQPYVIFGLGTESKRTGFRRSMMKHRAPKEHPWYLRPPPQPTPTLNTFSKRVHYRGFVLTCPTNNQNQSAIDGIATAWWLLMLCAFSNR